jgi:hypothetical protein
MDKLNKRSKTMDLISVSLINQIKKLVLRGERIEGTYRKGESDQFFAIHF